VQLEHARLQAYVHARAATYPKRPPAVRARFPPDPPTCGDSLSEAEVRVSLLRVKVEVAVVVISI
jgi:hypothetical protein